MGLTFIIRHPYRYVKVVLMLEECRNNERSDYI